MEKFFGIALTQAHGGTKNNATTKEITDCLQFFKKALKTRTRWFSIYSGSGYRRTPQGFQNQDYYLLGGKIYYEEEQFNLSITTPPQSSVMSEKLLLSLGDAIGAHSAQFTPRPFAERVRRASWCTVIDNRALLGVMPDKSPAEQCLPRICESAYKGLRVLQPHHIGWLNYWSQEVCEYVGFPDNAAGLESVLQHSYQTPRGAWIVKLGADPLEVGNEVQLQLLCDMYARFPRVGIRPPEGVAFVDHIEAHQY